MVWACCDTNKWSSSWQAALVSLGEAHWAFQECQSCHRTTLAAAAVTERLVAKGTLGTPWLRAESLRVGGWGTAYDEGRRRSIGEFSKTGLILWRIKRYHTSSDRTINTTVRVLRLLCAVQRAHYWRSCPGLRRRDRRRSGCRGSRCGWCTATQSDSSWCREPQPRCGRMRCMRTGSPRAEQQGYRRQQTRCGSTSTWTRWRWCSWASTPRPGCVCRLALLWHPQTPPNRKFNKRLSLIHITERALLLAFSALLSLLPSPDLCGLKVIHSCQC